MHWLNTMYRASFWQSVSLSHVRSVQFSPMERGEEDLKERFPLHSKKKNAVFSFINIPTFFSAYIFHEIKTLA